VEQNPMKNKKLNIKFRILKLLRSKIHNTDRRSWKIGRVDASDSNISVTLYMDPEKNRLWDFNRGWLLQLDNITEKLLLRGNVVDPIFFRIRIHKFFSSDSDTDS
jgi:hypothetical protein